MFCGLYSGEVNIRERVILTRLRYIATHGQIDTSLKITFFIHREFETGSDTLIWECDNVVPDQPDGRLMCSTKTNPATNEMLRGSGDWGFCEETYCPSKTFQST